MGNNASSERRRRQTSLTMRLSRAGSVIASGSGSFRGKQSPEDLQRQRELEKYCKPQGLYDNCPWDLHAVRAQILMGNLAPCRKGVEEEEEEEMEECPICLLFYTGGMNRATCCRHSICTECYLQVKDPKGAASTCPFCQSNRFHAVFRGALTADEKLEKQVEQQKVFELSIAKRNSELRRDREIADHVAKGMSLAEAQRLVAPDHISLQLTPSPMTPDTHTPLEMDSGSTAATTVTDPYDPYDDLAAMYGGDDVEDAMLREAIRRSMLDTPSNSIDRKDFLQLALPTTEPSVASAPSAREGKTNGIATDGEVGGGGGLARRAGRPRTSFDHLTVVGPGRSDSNLSVSLGGSYGAASNSENSEEEEDEETMMAAAIRMSLSPQNSQT
eukprot:gb/GEZN01007281.1/.p1 GENE.gb/GEZN01007281.1/~~gb/GEZN01007281.1/.p1  ORF type:complete len:387 (-),score=56.34 gb/GEZN01007281.1/:235-1395(-)